jgi:hypothetical protein
VSLGPEGAIGDGPYIYIAVSEPYEGVVPTNATRLLLEWEEALDPIRALVDASDALGNTWLVGGDSFVEPSWHTGELLRRAAEQERLREQFREGILVAAASDPARNLYPVVQLADDSDDPPIREGGLPFLLGLAVVAAIDNASGYFGRQAWTKLAAQRQEEEAKRTAEAHEEVERLAEQLAEHQGEPAEPD